VCVCVPLSLNASIHVSSLNAFFDLAIHCMIFGSLGVKISLETLIWNKKTQWSLYQGMRFDPLVVLNPSA